MPEEFDAIVIGAGQAGPFLAVKLAHAGQRVALIEREHLGGTCVNDGCTPTKTMVASARVVHLARRARDFGVLVPGPVTVDFAAVMARKDAVVNKSVSGLSTWFAATSNLSVIWGDARFTASKTVAVNDRTLRGEKIYINTGGRPVVPQWPGLEGVPYLTNTSIMRLTTLPQHLIIVGGSYIGLEFAQMFRRFGAQVTVFEPSASIIMREDPDVRAAVTELLADEGIAIHTGAHDFAIEGAGTDITLRATCATGPVAVCGSHLLLAIGRHPNTDTLNLDAAGIATNPRGFITTDPHLRTSAEGVFALGDVNGRGAFTHTSYNDHEIIADNLLHGGTRAATDRIPVYALFIDPPLARIGASETEIRASGRPALIGQMPMTRVARARERGETRGFMKVLVDAETQKILGATLFCIEGDEVIHSLLDVMNAGAPYTAIRDCVHIHPTVSELIPTLLGDLRPLAPD